MRSVSPAASLPEPGTHGAVLCFPGGLPARIYLVRHGVSAWNGTRRVTGQANPSLADKGREQATRLQRVFDGEPLTAVYCSTLDRSIATATPTARSHGLAICKRDALREQHQGILEGRFRDQRDPQAAHLWRERKADRWNFRAPGGESLADLQARAVPCLEDILRANVDGCVLIVGHQNTNRVLLGALLGWPGAFVQNLRIGSGYLYEIEPGNEVGLHTISIGDRDTGERYDGLRA
ncbi:MAG: histidine phosphatase family protein [Gammaproteobacteria bacterium]